MEIISYSNCLELDALADAWDRLSEKELVFIPSFSELRYQLENSGSKFRILVASDSSQITAIACFVYTTTIRSYAIATRKLFDVKTKEVSVFGSCVLGQPSENVIRKFFQLIIEGSDIDLIDVGHIFIDSPLHNAINNLPRGIIAWRERKKQMRWLIRLPSSFDEYFASLRATTRAAVASERRKLERESPSFRIMRLPEEVEFFLQDAEKISRLSYQWKLGYGLYNDENTRRRFAGLAKDGTLRCYILYLRGKPCAFSWGELNHRKFVWDTTGYDPHYRKLSPGTALLMWMIRDLVENTNCEIFDFKWGSEDGYKSRFATLRFSCARVHVAQIYKPHSFLIFALDKILNSLKNLMEKLLFWIFGRGANKRRLRSAMRRYGIATY
jgi:Acetyltransferase (GNAT) domain